MMLLKKKTHLKQLLVKTQEELEALKIKQQSDSKVKYKCKEFDVGFETTNQFKITHKKQPFAEYERDYNFEVYPCFYCDGQIKCSDELEAHETIFTVFDELLLSESACQDINVFSCDKCDFVSASMQYLLEHVDSYHPDNLVVTKENHEDQLYWCDICPLYFESDINLQFHKRGYHWDQFDRLMHDT